MKVAVTGKNSKDIVQLVKDLGFEMVSSNSDLVISYGGDGTLLSSERTYPGIPKLPIRDSLFCNKCSDHSDKEILEKLLSGKLNLKVYKKLETEIFYKTFYALNDFVVRNQQPTHTIRFKTSQTGDKLLIGDGVVISTTFGQTGYFKSITDQTFDTGFALAFNNTTEKAAPVILKDSDQLSFKLVRGKATLSMDNSADIFIIDEGSELIFKMSDQVAKIYEDTSLRCPKCQVNRG